MGKKKTMVAAKEPIPGKFSAVLAMMVVVVSLLLFSCCLYC
jgi:hypothetical protein